MDFRFANRRLESLYYEEQPGHGLSSATVDDFFEVMSIIVAAKDERDIRAIGSLHYEKLKGRRQHQHSLRLNRMERVIVEREKQQGGICLVIVGVEDYH